MGWLRFDVILIWKDIKIAGRTNLPQRRMAPYHTQKLIVGRLEQHWEPHTLWLRCKSDLRPESNIIVGKPGPPAFMISLFDHWTKNRILVGFEIGRASGRERVCPSV